MKKTIDVPVVHVQLKKELEMKYLFAGRLIDTINSMRGKLSDKRKYLQSYILNLETWLKEEKHSLNNLDEHIRKPFFSLFSNEQADSFLTERLTMYLEDLWLYKRFANYDINESSIESFKRNLYDDLKARISDISRTFSMYDYLTNPTNYHYLTNVDRDDVFTALQNMSVPFAQGLPTQRVKSILFCHVNSLETDNWKQVVESQYVIEPVLANDTSVHKITLIQIQKYNIDETSYYS